MRVCSKYPRPETLVQRVMEWQYDEGDNAGVEGDLLGVRRHARGDAATAKAHDGDGTENWVEGLANVRE